MEEEIFHTALKNRFASAGLEDIGLLSPLTHNLKKRTVRTDCTIEEILTLQIPAPPGSYVNYMLKVLNDQTVRLYIDLYVTLYDK